MLVKLIEQTVEALNGFITNDRFCKTLLERINEQIYCLSVFVSIL